MRRLAYVALLALVTIAAIRAAGAGEKPKVEVCFTLAEPAYKVEFASKMSELNSQAAALMAGKLAREAAFLDPLALKSQDCGATAPQSWRLWVRLDRAGANATGEVHAVGFHIRLTGPSADPDPMRKVYWTFRETGQMYDFASEVPAFLRELSEALDKADFGELVTKLLVQLPVPSQAAFYKDSIFGPGWEITTHTHEDLCLSESSELVVRSRLESGSHTSTRNIHTTVTSSGSANWWSENIRGEVSHDRNDPRILSALETLPENQVQVLAIYIEKYVLLRQCGGVAPQNAGL